MGKSLRNLHEPYLTGLKYNALSYKKASVLYDSVWTFHAIGLYMAKSSTFAACGAGTVALKFSAKAK